MDPVLSPSWDSTLNATPEQSVFQTASWAAVLKETFGAKPLYLIDESAEGVSLWPLMEIDSAITGRRGISLPYTDDCEPILPSESVAVRLFAEILRIGADQRWRYFELRGGSNLFPNAMPSVSYFTHVLRLNRDIKSLAQTFEGAVRRAVRKAKDSGVTTRVSNSWEAVNTFFELHCGTRKKHGVPPQPLAFFKNIHRHLISTGKGFVVTAFHDDRPIAAGVFFHIAGNAIYKFGASLEKLQHLRGSNLMMSAAIEHCVALNCRSLHFGRTSQDNEGLRRYKLGWGTEERRLDYLRYDFKTKSFVRSHDNSSGWHTHIFRHLPSFVSQGIGTALYKHIG